MKFLEPIIRMVNSWPIEAGEEQAFVLDDAVVVVGLDEGRELRIQVFLGPIRMDGMETGLTGDEDL